MSIVDQPCILQWLFLISCVSWGFFFSVTVEESPSSATLPRARLAYVGPAPERSHSLTDLSEAPLYRVGVFGLHGTSLDPCPLVQDRTSARVYLPGLFLHSPQRNILSVSKPLKTFCWRFFLLIFACASRILMSPPTLLNRPVELVAIICWFIKYTYWFHKVNYLVEDGRQVTNNIQLVNSWGSTSQIFLSGFFFPLAFRFSFNI